MMRHKNVAIAKAGNASTGVSAAERFLLDIIDTVREPLLVLDSDFRVTRANRTFFQTFHVAADTTIGNELFTLGDGQWDIPRLRELLRDRLLAEGELYDVEVEHVFPHIGRKIMMLNARLVTHEPDMPNVILLAIEDVTERRLTERRLATQRLELERSNAALKEFAFVASHDLQEPLRKIVSFGERLELAAGSRLDGDARHYLERMLDAATRMRTSHVGALVVVENRNGRHFPVGIITDRDIVVGVVSGDPEHILYVLASDIMSEELVTAKEHESVEAALKKMEEHGVRRLPIVDVDGGLVGILTLDDVLQFLTAQQSELVALVAREQRHERQYRL